MTHDDSRILAPSILSADFSRLGDQIGEVEPYSGLLHVDVMDGHFVPNITLGPPVVAKLKPVTRLPIDCHLMVEEPDRFIGAFAEAGTDLLSVHMETCPHVHRSVHSIKAAGMKAGVALNPATPVEALDVILEDLDFILIMSVDPGFGGQRFISSVLGKIQRLKTMLADRKLAIPIEVDGGVSAETIPSLLAAGADWFVAGSAVFGAPEPSEAARFLKDMMNG